MQQLMHVVLDLQCEEACGRGLLSGIPTTSPSVPTKRHDSMAGNSAASSRNATSGRWLGRRSGPLLTSCYVFPFHCHCLCLSPDHYQASFRWIKGHERLYVPLMLHATCYKITDIGHRLIDLPVSQMECDKSREYMALTGHLSISLFIVQLNPVGPYRPSAQYL